MLLMAVDAVILAVRGDERHRALDRFRADHRGCANWMIHGFSWPLDSGPRAVSGRT